jgi:hypothetical protein
MTARELLAWGDLDERRRRQHGRGLGRIPRPLVSLLGAGLLFAAVARSVGAFGADAQGDSTPADASGLLVAAIATLHVLVLFGAPFRMYWRRDSSLLGRLSIDGKALFTVALMRSARATLLVAVPCAVAALPFGIWIHWEIALRHLALVGIAALGAALMGPAVTLSAGAIVASDKADALFEQMGGEFRAPKTSWLGIFPGLAATGLALILIAASGWVGGKQTTAIGPAPAVLGVAAAAPVLLVLWAWSVADRVMLAAQREVSALDQERLAHVDLTRASWLERAWAAVTLRGHAGLLFDKDARLARRRFPIPYFLGLVGVIALWGIAAGAPQSMLVWSGTIAGSLGLYGIVMARRHAVPPIEHPRLLRTLAFSPGEVASAKHQRVISWMVIYPVLGSVPVVLRAAQPVTAAIVLGTILVVSLVGGVLASRV